METTTVSSASFFISLRQRRPFFAIREQHKQHSW